MTFKKGTALVVKSDAAYINAGAKATVAVDQRAGSIWVNVEWDEPKDGRVNGDYLAVSFDEAVAPKVDLTEAIAALVDKTYEAAFAAGEKSAKDAAKVDQATKDELNKAFGELTVQSNTVYNLLTKNGIL